MDNSDDRKKILLEALQAAKGIVSTACQNVEVARSTFYQWRDTDEAFKAAVDEIQESAIDWVESKLFEKINGVSVEQYTDDKGQMITYKQPPSDTAIIFYLKTKAKKRGYVERQELTGADGQPMQVQQITGMEVK